MRDFEYSIKDNAVEIHTKKPRYLLGRFCVDTDQCFIYDCSSGMIDKNTNIIENVSSPLDLTDWRNFCSGARRSLRLIVPPNLVSSLPLKEKGSGL